MIFLDTCALVKMVVWEEDSEALNVFLSVRQAQERVVSAIARTELPRVLRRDRCDDQGRPKQSDAHFDRVLLRAQDLLGKVNEIPTDNELLDQAGALEMFNIKALDRIQLASALTLGPALTFFVTYDRKLRRHAEAKGLRVIGPTDPTRW